MNDEFQTYDSESAQPASSLDGVQPTPAETPAAVETDLHEWTAPRPRRSERGRRGNTGKGARRRVAGADGDTAKSASDSARVTVDLLFVAMFVLLVGKAFLARYLTIADPSVFSAVLLETAGIFAVFGLTDLIWPRRSYTIDLLAYTLLSVLMLGNVLYVAFYEQMVDPHMLAFANQVGTVKDSIDGLLQPIHALFLVDVPFLALAAVLVRRRQRRSGGYRPTRRSPIVAGIAVAALAVFVVQVSLFASITGVVDGIAASRARGMGVWQVASLFRNVSGDSGEAIAREVEESVASKEESLTPQQAYVKLVESVRQAKVGSRVATFSPGAYAGKDVLVIQVESLNTMVIGRKVGGTEITPNLNRLLKYSWYFPNTYSLSSGGNTSDAEFVASTSLYAPPTGEASVLAYADREIPGLPRLLTGTGYSTVTMHANDAHYWNRTQLYPSVGFQKYYDKSYFGTADAMWRGASDQAVFLRTGEILGQLRTEGKPFYAHVVTMSSHPPFEYIPVERRPLKLPAEYRGTQVGNYVSAISYADLALGDFIEKLKREGVWENTIVVIYGDHSGFTKTKTPTDAKLVKQLTGHEYGMGDHQRVPLIVHLPGQQVPMVVKKSASQVDIMPTLTDLLGLDTSSTPMMGRSLFVDSDEIVSTRSYFPGGAVVFNDNLFAPGMGYADGRAYRLSDGAPAEPTVVPETVFERAHRLNALSESWLRSLPIRPDADSSEAFIPVKRAWKRQ